MSDEHDPIYGEGSWTGDVSQRVPMVALVDADGSIQSIDNILTPFHRNQGNEQKTPLGANQTFVGDWHDFSNMPAIIVVYASDVNPVFIGLEWSKDGETPGTDPFDLTVLHLVQQDGLYAIIDVENLPSQRYMRMKVVNGPTPQGFVISINSCLKGTFQGLFTSQNSPWTSIAPALLTRSLMAGCKPDGSIVNLAVSNTGKLLADLGGAVIEVNAQTLNLQTDQIETLLGNLGTYTDAVESLVATTNSNLAQLSTYVDGLEALAANLAKRPSGQAAGRTHVDKSVSSIAATTTIHTVTAGKTFYLTDLIYSWVSVQANAVLALSDGATNKLPLVGGQANTVQTGTLSFNEPIPFTTSVVATKVAAATLLASVTIVGYEE